MTKKIFNGAWTMLLVLATTTTKRHVYGFSIPPRLDIDTKRHSLAYDKRRLPFEHFPDNVLLSEDQTGSASNTAIRRQAKKTPVLSGFARRLSQFVFPPIASRRIDEPVHIWKEFAYGFQYMARLVGVFYACSKACTILRTMALANMSTSTAHSLVLRIGVSPLHYLDSCIKVHIRQWVPPVLSVNAWEFIQLNLVGPIVEEIIYRGLGHAWGWLMFVVPAVLLAHTCLLSRLLARFFLALFGVVLFSTAMSYVNLPFVYIEDWCRLLAELARCWAMVPAVKSIFMLSHGKTRKRRDARTNEKATDDGAVMTRLNECMCQRVYATVLWLNIYDSASPPRDFQVTLQRASAWSARLYGSACFGLAHLRRGVAPSWSLGLSSLQMCLGSFASSLLVESRLAVQRRNVWAAVGAHVAYNLLAPFWVLVFG